MEGKKHSRKLKNRWEPIFIGMCLLFWFLLFGGEKYLEEAQSPNKTTAQEHSGMIKIMLKAADHVEIEDKVRYVKKGEDAVFCVVPDPGYEIKGTDYEDYLIEDMGDGRIKLVLKNIKNPRAFLCICTEVPSKIFYDLNGGKWEEGQEKEGIQSCDLTLRKRPNTNNGLHVIRDGYELIGWNTEKDGSGVDIGLGSRVTIPESRKLTLFAKWLPENKEDDFYYVLRGGEARLTSCRGQSEKIVIPNTLEGYPVTSIAQGAFINKEADVIVLPDPIRSVESRAFINCKVKEVYMPDTIQEISDDSFSGCKNFSTLHINANTDPRYTKTVRMSNYVDKIDLLEQKTELPRMVFFAGSSMWFNLNGKMAEEAFDGSYQIVNLGLNGFYCSAAQMEIMLHYLGKGDVVVHAPEECSAQQLMTDNSMTQSLYACLELNYDLFSYVDIRNLSNVFSAFCEYNQVRSQMECLSYEDYPKEWCIDEYGSFALTLLSDGKNKKRKDEAYISSEDITETGMERLNHYYEVIQEKTGNKALVSYSAINYDGLSSGSEKEEWERYENRLSTMLNKEFATLFGNLEKSVMRGSKFYASNFHLTTEGAKEWTAMILPGIRHSLQK